MCVFLIPLLSENKKIKTVALSVKSQPPLCWFHVVAPITQVQNSREKEREDRWEETYSSPSSSSWRWNSTIQWISHSQRAGHRSYSCLFPSLLLYMQRRAILCFCFFHSPSSPLSILFYFFPLSRNQNVEERFSRDAYRSYIPVTKRRRRSSSSRKRRRAE